MINSCFIRDQFKSLGISINEHYLERYIKFITAIPEQPIIIYGESHHILPESLFNQYESRKMYPWNQRRIDARSHYLCHWMLHKAMPDNYQMAEAFAFMCVQNPFHHRSFNSKASALAKMKANELKSSIMKEKFKDRTKHPRTGKKLSNQQIDNLSRSHMGLSHSIETRMKMVESHKDRKYGILTCPHCGKSGKSSGLASWHFDYCSLNPNQVKRKRKSGTRP